MATESKTSSPAVRIAFPSMIKPTKLLRHNGTVRDINSPDNKAIANRINEAIDIMLECKAYASFTQSLRSQLSHYRGKYRVYALQKLKEGPMYSKDTSVGTVMIRSVVSSSVRNLIVDKALASIGQTDLECLINSDTTKEHMHCIFETSALKLTDIYLNTTTEITESFYADVEKLTSSDDTGVISAEDAFIAMAIKWIRNHRKTYAKYLTAHHTARDEFMIGSRDKKFPRIYVYKRVNMLWDYMCMRVGRYPRIVQYLQFTDTKLLNDLQNAMFAVRKELDEHRPMFSLDGYDYDEE